MNSLWVLLALGSLQPTTFPLGTTTSPKDIILSFGSGQYLPIHYVLLNPLGRISASS
jgi:hypothetical protein